MLSRPRPWLRTLSLALLIGFVTTSLVACCTGRDPQSVPAALSAPPGYVAVAQPGAEFGWTSAAKSAIMIPPNVIDCGTHTAAKVLEDLGEGLRCAVNAAFPEKVPVAFVPDPSLVAPANACSSRAVGTCPIGASGSGPCAPPRAPTVPNAPPPDPGVPQSIPAVRR